MFEEIIGEVDGFKWDISVVGGGSCEDDLLQRGTNGGVLFHCSWKVSQHGCIIPHGPVIVTRNEKDVMIRSYLL